MTRRRRQPGQDHTARGPEYNPSSGTGAGGVFAEIIQGATPKYILGRGPRRDTQQRNTMARLFVRVDQSEYDDFLDSITDDQVRERLVERLAGDPTSPRRRGEGIVDTGYMDFLLTSVSMPLSEKVQVSEALSDNHVVFAFGQNAPVWSYSGYLINSYQDDQATNFMRLYLSVLRATQLARRQKVMAMRYDSYTISGVMTNLVLSIQGANELLVPFQFNVIVKRFDFTHVTRGWVPTRPGGPFAADPLLVPYDGRPRKERVLSEIVARTPPGTVEGPTGDHGAHPNAHTAEPAALSSGASHAPAPAPVAADTIMSRVSSADPNIRPRTSGATP